MLDKIINLSSKVFTNKANNQKSITIPSKIFKEMEKQSGKPVDILRIQILSPNEVRAKISQQYKK